MKKVVDARSCMLDYVGNASQSGPLHILDVLIYEWMLGQSVSVYLCADDASRMLYLYLQDRLQQLDEQHRAIPKAALMSGLKDILEEIDHLTAGMVWPMEEIGDELRPLTWSEMPEWIQDFQDHDTGGTIAYIEELIRLARQDFTLDIQREPSRTTVTA